MKNSEYKELIRNAGYKATPEFVEEVKKEHKNLADIRLLDTVFKRLYRSKNAPENGSPEAQQKPA